MPKTREEHVICTREELNNYEYYKNIIEILKLEKISSYIDIGANVGEFCNVIFDKIPTLNAAYLIESEIENMNFTKSNIRNNNIKYENINFYNVAIVYNIEAYDRESGYNIEVKISTLEDLNIPIVDFVKIDVDGGEYNIIPNSKFLQKVKWIDIEFHDYDNIPVKEYVKKYFPNHKIVEIEKTEGRCLLRRNIIYDVFTFNNELDMLEIRLNILDDYVDYFIIVEASETFSGVKKPLNYETNKERYKKFEHKIRHYVITDTPNGFNDTDCDQSVLYMASNSTNVTREHLCWLKEFYQKELIKNALIDLNDNDICYISDVDEIWNYKLKFEVDNKIYKPMIDLCYINYLNVKTSERWTIESNPFTGPIVTKYLNIKNDCLNHLRTLSKTKYEFIENGGWHFNALGGIDKKLEDFKHPIYTKSYMQGRETGSVIDELNLPEYLIINKEKYSKFFY
jgi:beta-1,4-mannosyl-glycoprotein beta-1,4-N-acetylglucosaminyltransferase